MERRIERNLRLPEDYVWEIQHPPYHLEESGVIYNGTFQGVLGTLQSNSIDLIVTDPPYGINFRGCGMRHSDRLHRLKGNRHQLQSLVANDSPTQSLVQLEALFLFARRLLRPGGCCCFCCPGGARRMSLLESWVSLLTKHLDLKELVVWDKGGLGMGTHYRQNYEYVIVAKKPGATCRWNGNSRVTNIVRAIRRIPRSGDHPTPKPVALMHHFINLHSLPGDVVLDPFAGQGPTLVAARNAGRKFIGIECELAHCQAIVTKLELD